MLAMCMRPLFFVLSWLVLLATQAASASAAARDEDRPTTVLFENVRIFNGVDPELAAGHVLVEGNSVAKISKEPIPRPRDVVVVNGGNRILSPGFIDLHAHLTAQMPRDQLAAHPWVVGGIAGDAAEYYL